AIERVALVPIELVHLPAVRHPLGHAGRGHTGTIGRAGTVLGALAIPTPTASAAATSFLCRRQPGGTLGIAPAVLACIIGPIDFRARVPACYLDALVEVVAATVVPAPAREQQDLL